MDAPLNQIFFPVSFNDLYSAWERFPNAVPFAGGTEIIRRQGKNIPELPPVILSLNKLEDLHRITRTERYLEIGSMENLSRIISLGKIVPDSLCRCLEKTGGLQLRNTATIGGAICSLPLLDISAPLTALEAQFELRGARSSRWISAARFYSAPGALALEKQELLTRIRLPMDQWDYSIYKKFHSNNIYNTEVMVFLAKTHKNTLTDIRVVYKTDAILRNKTAEGILSGEALPLSVKAADNFIENWKEFFADAEIDKLSQKEFLSSIETNVYNLTE